MSQDEKTDYNEELLDLLNRWIADDTVENKYILASLSSAVLQIARGLTSTNSLDQVEKCLKHMHELTLMHLRNELKNKKKE